MDLFILFRDSSTGRVSTTLGIKKRSDFVTFGCDDSDETLEVLKVGMHGFIAGQVNIWKQMRRVRARKHL
jgi:dihydrodipicolinate synthase/N-acetylneuraminate lyase